MEEKKRVGPPLRISEVAELKRQGAAVTIHPNFEIVPVDFTHRENQFQAFIFLCRYSGEVNGKPYSFRKCYARGCPHNLCPHVSLAVMIANRYLQRDYRVLRAAGIDVDETRLFSLGDMVVKFEDYRSDYGPPYTLDDYIRMANEGNQVSVETELEYLPAVEHFANHENAQTFLHASFIINVQGDTRQTHRCLACYPTEQEKDEKPQSIQIANERLRLLYKEFDEASIQYVKRFFE